MRRILFNEGWTFAEGTGTSLDFQLIQTADPATLKAAKTVTLPHDAMIETERKNFFGGVCTGFYEPKNIYYTKSFELPAEEEGKSIWLEFEGIYQLGLVYLNEQFVGRCMNGYTDYYIDISQYVVFDKPNHLKVVVRNGVNSSRWYSGGGIYRDVHILIGDPLHVKCEGTRITTKELDDGYALIEVLTPVEYTGCARRLVRVLNELIDGDGNVVASDNVPLTMQKAGCKDVIQKINVVNPKTWNLENPYLYTCRTTILEGETVADTAESTFGIRQFQLDAVNGLRLNGKTVKLKGGCLHHDNGVVGVATFKESEERRLRRLQAAGYNAVRTGAHPFAKCVLDICDRIGMLVYDELCDTWTTSKVAFDYTMSFVSCWEKDLESLVLRDYNHPCVVFYGIGNEIQELDTADGQDWARKLSGKVHSIDSTRFTTLSMNPIMCLLDKLEEIMQWGKEAATEAQAEQQDPEPAKELKTNTEEAGLEINSTMNKLVDQLEFLWHHPMSSSMTEEVCAQIDITGYNYSTGLYEIDHTRYPNRVMFGSETYPKWLAKNWEIIERCPYIIGDFCWTAWDYLGETGIGEVDHNDQPKPQTAFYGTWPWRTASVGAFDLIGDELPIGYWREIVWNSRTAPYAAVRPPQFYGRPMHDGAWSWISDCICSWTWPGFEGKPVQIEVYSKADWVELFVNGKSIGKKDPGSEFQYVALFETTYEPGEIKAVDSNGEEFTLQTACDESQLKAFIDVRELADKNRELTHIEISICDKNGVLNAASAKKVHIEIEGAGVIQGFGTADPLSIENFFDSDVTAFHGRLLAVVRHDKTGEPVRVTLKAEGCEDVIISL